MRKSVITSALAGRLVAAQFPEWADLPVSPVQLDGWDNATFRLGDDLSVRLPTADRYIAQVEKEHRWLPVLASALPLPIPEPVAMGQPDDEFPRPWSVYRWIDGDPASIGNVSSLTDFARDLGGFLVALHAIGATDGPSPGQHSFFRGGPVHIWDDEVRASFRLLPEVIDADAVAEVWNVALASRWEQEPFWVHGDITASNLLVSGGKLGGVIDFGCCAVGDPACDLAIAWTYFTPESREAFRATLRLDDATWARGRGWALWKALNTLAHERTDGLDTEAAARRFGWRWPAYGVISEVLTDGGIR